MIYNQLDPRWAKETLGNTRYSIGRWGCLTSGLASFLSYYGKSLTPFDCAKTFTYNQDGNLQWPSIRKVGLKLVGMHRAWNQETQQAVDAALKHPKKGAILHVNGVHFVLALGRIPTRYRIGDSLGGTVKYTLGGYRLTGARIVELL